MTIRRATTADRVAWDAFVDAREDFFPLRYAWAAILAQTYGVVPVFFIAMDDGGTVGGVCATYCTGTSRKRMLYGLRFGLLADVVATRNALLDCVRAFAEQYGCRTALVWTGRDPVALGGGGVERTTVVLPIAQTDDAAWDALRKKTRNVIRKGQRVGLALAEGRKYLPAFYAVYARRMLAKGVPIHDFTFFAAIIDALPDRARLMVAMHHGDVVAGMLMVHAPRFATYPYQACAVGAEGLAANAFLLWEAMRWCIARGIPELDMGESRVGSGVYDAKVFFGGAPRPVYYSRTVGGGGADVGPPPRARLRIVPRPHDPVGTLLRLSYAIGPFVVSRRIGVWCKRNERIF